MDLIAYEMQSHCHFYKIKQLVEEDFFQHYCGVLDMELKVPLLNLLNIADTTAAPPPRLHSSTSSFEVAQEKFEESDCEESEIKKTSYDDIVDEVPPAAANNSNVVVAENFNFETMMRGGTKIKPPPLPPLRPFSSRSIKNTEANSLFHKELKSLPTKRQHVPKIDLHPAAVTNFGPPPAKKKIKVAEVVNKPNSKRKLEPKSTLKDTASIAPQKKNHDTKSTIITKKATTSYINSTALNNNRISSRKKATGTVNNELSENSPVAEKKMTVVSSNKSSGEKKFLRQQVSDLIKTCKSLQDEMSGIKIQNIKESSVNNIQKSTTTATTTSSEISVEEQAAKELFELKKSVSSGFSSLTNSVNADTSNAISKEVAQQLRALLLANANNNNNNSINNSSNFFSPPTSHQQAVVPSNFPTMLHHNSTSEFQQLFDLVRMQQQNNNSGIWQPTPSTTSSLFTPPPQLQSTNTNNNNIAYYEQQRQYYAALVEQQKNQNNGQQQVNNGQHQTSNPPGVADLISAAMHAGYFMNQKKN
jgi:hypothetical protein